MIPIPWFKVDDKLHDHRKARGAGATAMGVWLLAGSWAADNLTDGFVPVAVLGRWGRPRDAQRLVDVGLWNVAEQDGEKGWRFHGWDEFQPTSKAIEARREAESKAGVEGNHRRWHVAKGITKPDCSFCRVGIGSPDADPNRGANPPEPVPVPVPTTERTTSSLDHRAKRSETPERFEEFWTAYDNKQGRKKAEAAYRAALKKPGVTDDLLIAAASSYVAFVKSENKHPHYTKHPTTWLNGEHWNDERAARTQPQTRIGAHMALVEQLADEQHPRAIGDGR